MSQLTRTKTKSELPLVNNFVRCETLCPNSARFEDAWITRMGFYAVLIDDEWVEVKVANRVSTGKYKKRRTATGKTGLKKV